MRILSVLDRFAPERKITVKKRKSVKPSAEQRLCRDRDPARRDGKHAKLKELRNKCTTHMRKEARDSAMKEINEDPNYMWQCLGKLTGKSNCERLDIREDGCSLSEEKAASQLNEYFLGKQQSLCDGMSDGEDPLRWK